ncbi:MAG: 4-hydroxythreonine-4-phosphate dehydrogenase PdxA [Acidimicrobiia bacterium]|nr:4-hydroxythreonine-4-phosphate dehydrogenase PdxA [Acidimicrobiia bacterium]
MTERPLIAITQGDPCGIGPEVVARALGGGRPYAVARPVVIGCVESMEAGVAVAGVDLKVRRISSLDGVGMDPGRLDVLDEGRLDPGRIQPGRAVAECGRANGAWLATAAELCTRGDAAGTVMAPVNAEALVRGAQRGRSSAPTRPPGI